MVFESDQTDPPGNRVSQPAPARRTARATLARLAAVWCSLGLALLVAACSTTSQQASTTPNPVLGTCPVPSPSLIPSDWRPVGSGTLINVDGDEDYECLVIYRYNVGANGQGPLGGVIFDPQVGVDRVSNLATYRLLPWVNRSYVATQPPPGSQPGYLGDLGWKSAQARLYDANADGKADELGIAGTDNAGNVTTLSLYRWANPADGYHLLGYFHGNNQVQIVDAPLLPEGSKVYSGTVRLVNAVNDLYDRSALAMVYQYMRRDTSPSFEFRSNWLTFLSGQAPLTCYYPEGQVLAGLNTVGRPVFDLQLWGEDKASQRATVCAGYWNVQGGTAQRYWSFFDLEMRQSTSVGACDQWVVIGPERIERGRITCSP